MKALKSFFKFYRKERNGILVLFVFILVAQCYLYVEEYGVDEQILFIHNEVNSSVDTAKPIISEKALFYFDPNKISAQEANGLGISAQQFKNLLNYRNAGGVFTKPSDLSKLYTFDESLCKQLIPYIRLDKETKQFSIELNTAKEKDFQNIKGVGKKLSQRIVRFREALGGFVDKKQLYEVYGLDAKIVDQAIANFRIDKSNVSYISLNKASEKEFKKHPYFSSLDAKAIIAYREENGSFKSIDGIDLIDVISSEKREKIKPYLVLE